MELIYKLLDNCKNVDNFVEFFRFFVDSAKQFNLTSITDEKDVCVKHFLDSLQGEQFFDKDSTVLEIGSGGGFPSVPLKIERSDLKFTLIEATQKKCNYLNQVKSLLSFNDFTVINGRCEELAHDQSLRASFDFACAGAVASLNVLVEYLIPFLKVGGKAICYKGSNYLAEIENAQNALLKLDAKVSFIKEYDLGEDYGKHAIVVIEKLKDTKSIYPRHQSKIGKSPL